MAERRAQLRQSRVYSYTSCPLFLLLGAQRRPASPKGVHSLPFSFPETLRSAGPSAFCSPMGHRASLLCFRELSCFSEFGILEELFSSPGGRKRQVPGGFSPEGTERTASP